MAKNQHVTHNPNGGWNVRGEGNVKPTKILNTKADAIEYAKEICKNNETELFIHGMNGKIQSRNSYGNDPFPPKDKN